MRATRWTESLMRALSQTFCRATPHAPISALPRTFAPERLQIPSRTPSRSIPLVIAAGAVVTSLAVGLAAGLSFVPGTVRAQEVPEALTRVLAKSGLDQLGAKSRVVFTFNVQAGDKEASRSWDWNLREDTVRQDGAEVGKTPKFINDVYWLLFPAMVAWDAAKVAIETHEGVAAPISGAVSTQLVIRYLDGSGASPNDVYKLYVAPDDTVVEWSYHKAGVETPSRITSWEAYETIGGLHLSLERMGEEFRIWFTDVVVE